MCMLGVGAHGGIHMREWGEWGCHVHTHRQGTFSGPCAMHGGQGACTGATYALYFGGLGMCVHSSALTHLHALWKRLAISGLQVPGMALSLGFLNQVLSVINQSLLSALCTILLSCLGIIVSYSDI